MIKLIQTNLWVKEAIEIRMQVTTMNREKGQYPLSHNFDNYLKKSSSNLLAAQQTDKNGTHRIIIPPVVLKKDDCQSVKVIQVRVPSGLDVMKNFLPIDYRIPFKC